MHNSAPQSLIHLVRRYLPENFRTYGKNKDIFYNQARHFKTDKTFRLKRIIISE